MNFTNILTTIGIIVSTIFGIWGIIVTLRNRYQGEILYLKESNISLFDEIAKNIPQLAITYSRKAVKPNLVLIKGAFVNSGKVDISESMIEQPLTLNLKHSNWLEASIISHSESVNASISFNDEKNMVINTGLWRKSEFIQIQALAEVQEDKKIEGEFELESVLEKDLTFTHRIEDTKKIHNYEIINEKHISKKIKSYIILTVAACIFALISYFVLFMDGDRGKFLHTINVPIVGEKEIIVQKIAQEIIYVSEYEGDFKGEYDLDTFNSMYIETNGIVPYKMGEIFIVFSLAFYIFVPALFTFIRYQQIRKNRKLLQLVYPDEKIA